MSEPTPCPKCGQLHNLSLPCPTKEVKEAGRKILNQEDVYEHVRQGEKGGHVRLVEMKELLGNTSEACVDGRGELGVIGIPGGNAGELALYLDSYEKISGKKLTEQEVEDIFEKYLAAFGKFYLHTDGHALHHMGIHNDEELSNPPVDQRDELLDKLTNPDNIGCGHLKLAMKNPKEYGLNPDLIKFIIKAFFKKLWAKDSNVEFVILDGEHTEGAVLIVKVETDKVDAHTNISTISPNVGGTSAFVYHPQAVEFMRRESAGKINEVVGGVTGQEVDENEFAERMIDSGNRVLGETVGRLARDNQGSKLPFFEITFDENGQVKDVEEI